MSNPSQTNELLIKIKKIKKKIATLRVQSDSEIIYNIAPFVLARSFITELFDNTIVETSMVANKNLAMLQDYPDILVISYLQFIKEKQYGIAVRTLILLYTVSNNTQSIKELLKDLYFDDLTSMEKLSDIPISIIFSLIGIKYKGDSWPKQVNSKNRD